MIEQVVVVIEAELLPGTRLTLSPMENGAAMVEPVSHYKDEREIAKALRRLADKIEQGAAFCPVNFSRIKF